ncbi:hypothetical protein EJ04DRAFT_509007 [Polyplosphaeria fusca]|uniref:PWWP domain-containing protein n=1 Tax=Polyplosphaeria fusca TaxID=682080 RepID=A0A9P4V7H1_9PLEO|nr:hypothetical protein EJ04DRAFT_509007 [Polyplosphaeria fusca]
MADEANTIVPVDTLKAMEEPTRSAEVPTESAVVEPEPERDSDAPAGKGTEEAKIPVVEDAPAAIESTATDLKTDPTTDGGDTVAEPSADTAATNGTPASKKANNGRRKSGAGVPEHKKKTPSKKKKGVVEQHLDAEPGQHWFVAMKGYPPWPVVVAEEEMLPESLLGKRPVSARRIDGTYREDFRDGGKNAKDRRYPVMFLSTNEFAWQVNTDLQPLDIATVKKEVETGNTTKKSKALWDAYKIAAEEHDIAWYKGVLESHEAALQADLESKEAKKNKTKRKSTAAIDESEDVDMEDVEDEGTASAKKAKPSKKRKIPPESDENEEKPAKTPKLKLSHKAKDQSASKPKKESKPKKVKKSESEESESVKVEEKPMTEEERLEKRENFVLYLRHRLQKGFISRDQAPKESEMVNMSDYLKQLEAHKDLEASVIKKTKVHKVLKAIIKLDSIPKEDEYQFKKRSNELLNSWNRALAAEAESAVSKLAGEPVTNGVKHGELEEKEQDIKPSEAPEAPKATDDDVPMAEAGVDGSVIKDDNTDAAAEPAPAVAV